MQIKNKYLSVNQSIINMDYFKLKLANFIINKKKDSPNASAFNESFQ
jgi:hypothetical protein